MNNFFKILWENMRNLIFIIFIFIFFGCSYSNNVKNNSDKIGNNIQKPKDPVLNYTKKIESRKYLYKIKETTEIMYRREIKDTGIELRLKGNNLKDVLLRGEKLYEKLKNISKEKLFKMSNEGIDIWPNEYEKFQRAN